ncbi:MAG: DUF484 family protein [Magnetococcales bacterium]|nr:DUF484 family protein [Magnetococcales bacterium]
MTKDRSDTSDSIVTLEQGRLAQLRRDNQQMREQMDQMLERIQHNDRIYHAFHDIQMHLLLVEEPIELIVTLTRDLEQMFQLYRVTVTLSDRPDGLAMPLAASVAALPDRLLVLEQALLSQIMTHPETTVIRIGREGENRRLFFGADSGRIRSEAIVPLRRMDETRQLLGTLNLGSDMPTRFLPSYSTDLIQDLADVFTVCLMKILKSTPS